MVFPCQISSQAGKRLGSTDPRGEKVPSKALDLIGSAQPLLVVLENVLGFKSVQRGDYYHFMVTSLHNNGLHNKWLLGL